MLRFCYLIRHWVSQKSFPVLHFVAFVTACLLAVNTSHVQMPLHLFSAKFAFRILLSVWISVIIQEMKISGKMSKLTKISMQQMTDPSNQQSAANQHQVFFIFIHYWQCIVGKTMHFPDLKTNTNNQPFRSKLASHACEQRAGLIHLLANRD